MKGYPALSKDAARRLRSDLKAALTGFANGQGSVDDVLQEIERIAKYASGKPDIAVGRAGKAMKRLVRQYAPAQLCDTGLPGVCWDDLYSGVVRARMTCRTRALRPLVGARVATLATCQSRHSNAHGCRSPGLPAVVQTPWYWECAPNPAGLGASDWQRVEGHHDA